MSQSTLMALFLLLAIGLGGFYWISMGELDEAPLATEDEARIAALRADLLTAQQELADQVRRNRVLEETQASLEQRLKTLQSELADEATRVASLEEKLKASQLAAKAVDTKHNAKIEDVVSLFDKLKKKGDIATFLSGSELADMVSMIKDLGEEGMKALTDMLGSEDPADRILAAQILMNFDDPSAIAPLEKMALGDDDEMAKRWASQALLRMNSDGIQGTLQNLVKNAEDPGVKVNSLFGLCRHGNEWGVERAVAFIQSDDQPDALKNALLGGLLSLRDEAIAPIIDTLVRIHPEENGAMQAAINYYKNLGTPLGTQRLQSMASNASLPQSIRTAAQAALN